MEHHNSSTHYLMWKVQSQFPTAMNSFRSPPFIHESLVWPPRSYPCSFCRREFRSAQALGGHMNVHRRDRAKLKQSSPLPPKTTLTPPPLMNCGGGEESGRRGEDNFGESDVVCKRHKLICFSAIEEIDLELRLGAPVVKLGHIS